MAETYLSIEPIALALRHGDSDFRLAVDTALSHIYRQGEITASSVRFRATHDPEPDPRQTSTRRPACRTKGIRARRRPQGFMRLSVLDQSIAVAGRPHDQSIRNTVALARHCEALGYDRFWVSEHHNHPTIVGTAPEILIAAIAATTQRIRIGSAGIMLPHYSRRSRSPRCSACSTRWRPGASISGWPRAGVRRTYRLRAQPGRQRAAGALPADVRDLIAWVHGEPLVERHPFATVKAFPQGATAPEIWILGSSDYGAQVAALFGLPYCYAWFSATVPAANAQSTSISAAIGRACAIPSRVPASASGRWPPRPWRRRNITSRRAPSPA